MLPRGRLLAECRWRGKEVVRQLRDRLGCRHAQLRRVNVPGVVVGGAEEQSLLILLGRVAGFTLCRLQFPVRGGRERFCRCSRMMGTPVNGRLNREVGFCQRRVLCRRPRVLGSGSGVERRRIHRRKSVWSGRQVSRKGKVVVPGWRLTRLVLELEHRELRPGKRQLFPACVRAVRGIVGRGQQGSGPGRVFRSSLFARISHLVIRRDLEGLQCTDRARFRRWCAGLAAPTGFRDSRGAQRRP